MSAFFAMKKLSEFREEYHKGELHEADMLANPMAQFAQWMDFVIESGLSEPNAMILATSTLRGIPSARVVLLKEINEHGFVFFTNYLSRKGKELLENPFASLVFDWHEIERQVRIEGRVQKISDKASDEYFNSRPENAKIGAWTSPQSKIIKDREELNQLQTSFEEKFRGQEVRRPSHWGGFILLPTTIEFWQGRPNRLHDRLVYHKTEEGWTMHRLAP